MQITITQGLPEGGRQIRLSVLCRNRGSVSRWNSTASTTPPGMPFCGTTAYRSPQAASPRRRGVELHHRTSGGPQRAPRRSPGQPGGLRLEEKARSLGGNQSVLCAQVRAQGFYESLGYRAWGGELFDEGVPHVMMRKKL